MDLVSVILSGGAGSRLWPVSRELHPKPFMKMDDGKTLLQKTFARVAEFPEVSEVMTVTNRDLYFKTEDDYSLVNTGKLPTSFILEPFGRNTAPAIALAALQVAKKHNDDTLLLVLAADHLIENQSEFEIAVSNAIKLAKQGYLVTFGIQPLEPEIGFGYIEVSTAQNLGSNAHLVKQFVEKPSQEKAQEYVKAGQYFWNSGMFCFSAGVLLEEMEQHAPEILLAAQACLKNSSERTGENTSSICLNKGDFGKVPDISIDFALMEKSKKVAMVSCDIGWSDIGSWGAFSELKEPDENGNRIIGETLLYDVSNCYIQNEGRLLGMIGVEDLIIVDTEDALLIANKSRGQDVKEIVSQLKLTDHDLHRSHRQIHRPWGTYTVLEDLDGFKIKKIEVKPGGMLSLQMHHHRCEHWIVVSGAAKVTNNGQELFVNTNESTYIQAGHKHRLENPGKTPLVIIEVQTGEYLGEDDIVRFEDNYGRLS